MTSLVSIGDLASDLRSGFACGKQDEDGVVQFRMNNVTREGTIDWAKLRRVPSSAVRNGLTLAPGDILFNATNSPELVGKTALFTGFDEDVTFSNHFVRLRPKLEKADSGYVARWLQSQFEKGIFGGMCRQWVNQATVTKDQLSTLQLPLPPLDEQRRIAAILDKADALRRKRKRALELLDGLAQARFVSEFSSENGVMALGDVLQDIDSGWSPTCLDRAAGDEEAGALKLSAITQGHFKASENKAFPSNVTPRARDEVMRGDILFCRKNTRELVGSSAYVWETPSRLFISDLIFRLVPKLAIVDPIYLQVAVSSAGVRREISALSAGSAGSMPNISKSKLREVSIPMPDVERQRRFGKFVRVANTHRRQQAAGFAALEAQFASLQHRAFSGQL